MKSLQSETRIDPAIQFAVFDCNIQNGINTPIFQEEQTIHRHDFSEIVFLKKGSLLHIVNSEVQELSAGAIVFLRPDDRHFFKIDPNRRETVEAVILDFDLELFLSLSVYLENDTFLQKLTKSVLPPLFKPDQATFSSIYKKLARLNLPDTPPQMRKIKFKILLGEIFSRFFIDIDTFLTESQIPDWLEELCTKMKKEENLKGGIKRMQQIAYRTPGHLCKSFQKYLHRTPTDFLNELRLNRAACLLEEGKKDILEITMELNFHSVSRFYCLFKKYYGTTPRAYKLLHSRRQSLLTQ